MSKEAMKLAQELRALADRFSEGWHEGIKIDASDIVLLSDAAEALAEQPAQQQEPVAWITKNGKGWLRWHKPEDNEKNKDSTPLYTSPPASKPWVGLTQQEHADIAIQCGCMSADWVLYGATVERILKGKNS